MVEEAGTTQYVAVSTIEPESSAPPPYSPVSNNNKSGKPSQASPRFEEQGEPDIFTVRTKPVTNGIRSTIQYLRSRAGYWSRFRGLSLFICFTIARGFIISGLSAIRPLRNPLGISAAAVLAEVILARWQLTWIHIVISEPSSKRWYQRLPSFRSSWTRIAPVVALHAVVMQIVKGFPVLVLRTFGPMKHIQHPEYEPSERDVYAAFGQASMAAFLILALYILLAIPATVTLVRVAASMLPEEDETIVPFDRTFSGKVTPAIIGGAGKIGMLQAWKSFGWSSRKRLLKLLAKVSIIMFALTILSGMLLMSEAKLLLGDKMKEIMRAAHAH